MGAVGAVAPLAQLRVQSPAAAPPGMSPPTPNRPRSPSRPPPDSAQDMGLPPPAPGRPFPTVLVAGGAGVALVVGLVLYFLLRGGPSAEPPAPPPTPENAAAPEEATAEEEEAPPSEGHTRVVITVEPADSVVRVNGRGISGKSPFVLPDVDTRWPVKVRVEHKGFKAHEQELPLKAPKTTVSVNLQPLPPGAPEETTDSPPPPPPDTSRTTAPPPPRPSSTGTPRKPRPPKPPTKPGGDDDLMKPSF